MNDQQQAHNTIRLFGGIKRDKNMLCLLLAEIATKLNIHADRYMGEDETKDYEWLDNQIKSEIEQNLHTHIYDSLDSTLQSST